MFSFDKKENKITKPSSSATADLTGNENSAK
jgi:hypothetical protein